MANITVEFPADTGFPLVSGVWKREKDGSWVEDRGPQWHPNGGETIEAVYPVGLFKMLGLALEQSAKRRQTVDDIVAEASRRTTSHVGARSQRKMAGNHDLVGLMGEWTFARRYGYRVDLRPRAKGQGGRNFRTPLGSVDVRTARSPVWLWLEVAGPSHSQVLFLAGYDDITGRARLVGWEWAEEMRHCQQVISPAGLLCHQKASEDLRPVEEFDALMWDDQPDPPKWQGPMADWPERASQYIRRGLGAGIGNSGDNDRYHGKGRGTDGEDASHDEIGAL